jgi:hypothetical protein
LIACEYCNLPNWWSNQRAKSGGGAAKSIIL